MNTVLGHQSTLPVNFDGIPTTMKAHPQWVLWRTEQRDGKATKVPYQPSDRRASTTDPQTWSSFDEVQQAYEAGGFDGVGFVFSEYDDLVFIDLDGCRDPQTGEPREWSPELRQRAPGLLSPIDIIAKCESFVETSPSGTGFHLYCRGILPPGGRKIGGKGSGCPDGFEIYDQGRYAAVTGRGEPTFPAEPSECAPALEELHQAAFGRRNEPKQPIVVRSEEYPCDHEIIERAGRAANGDQFRKLWAGDHSDYPSPSEADLALAGMLAFWVGPQPETIERLMRQSALAREKWGRDDYIRRTIDKAIEGKTEFWRDGGSGELRPAATTLPAPRRDFPLTDSGNAERFADQHRDDVRYVYQWGKWLVWDSKRWRTDATAAVERLGKATVRQMYTDTSGIENDGLRRELATFARKSESADRRASMLRLARSELPIPIEPASLDADPWLLNCANGTLDLRTGRLREHRREDFITKLTPVVYDANAKAPVWEAFLSRIFDGDVELVQFVQRLLGYCLTGRVSEQVLPILYGSGSNGKSTLIEIIMAVLGEDYSAKAPRDLLLAKRYAHPTEMTILHGRRLVAASRD